MAGKPLKTLASQLKKNHGMLLVSTFDASFTPGTVVNVAGWNDITKIDHLSREFPNLPAVEGPSACLLADFKRNHELSVDAAATLVQAPVSAKVQFQKASDVVCAFDSPVTYSLSLLGLEDLLESTPAIWTKALGQALKLKRTHVVFQTVRGRISFLFRGSGGIGIDLQSGALGNLSSAGLGTGWKWRNEATLESKQEVLIAVEAARYNATKQRFEV